VISLRAAFGSAWLPFSVGVGLLVSNGELSNLGIVLVCWGLLRWKLKGRSNKEGCH